MEQPSKPKRRLWKWVACGIGGALLVALIGEEVRVRWNNHRNEREWEAVVRAQIARLSMFPTISEDSPAIRAYAIGRVVDARSNGTETLFLSMKRIERRGASYREDAKRVFDEHFSGGRWRDAEFWFSGEQRAATVRAKTTDGGGATRNWYIEFKRLGEKVYFVYLDKGASETSFTEMPASRVTSMMLSQSDDPGGVGYVECAVCGGRVLDVDHKNFPLLWIVQDRTTWEPVSRDTPSQQAGQAPVCSRCAASLPANFVYRMK